MIETPPKTRDRACFDYITGNVDSAIYPLIDKINDGYEYWDKVKYKKPLPKGVTPEILWSYVKASRLQGRMNIWPKYGVKLQVTNQMQRFCHDFDMQFGSFFESDNPAAKAEKMQYQTYSQMEEAIYSSMLEGASTTRRIAKEMLVRGISPKDKSQQMIYNNYQTMQYIAQHKDDLLTEERLLYIHGLMTHKTLKNETDAGRFRVDEDNIVIQNEHGTGMDFADLHVAHQVVAFFFQLVVLGLFALTLTVGDLTGATKHALADEETVVAGQDAAWATLVAGTQFKIVHTLDIAVLDLLQKI